LQIILLKVRNVNKNILLMDEGKKAQVVCVDNKNMHGVRDKPDLEF
jgi:hypothetical protein